MFKVRNLVPVIKAAQAGDEAAIQSLLEQYEPLISKYARNGRYQVNEDAFQELCLHFYSIIMGFDIEKMRRGR